RHFEWGELVFKDVPKADVLKALPVEWQTPISDAERSMHRCFVGEWIFATNFIARMSNERNAASVFSVDYDYAYEHEEDLKTKISPLLAAPLLQRQDTDNRYADNFLKLIETIDVPLSDLKSTLQKESNAAKNAQHRSTWLHLYNPVGNLIAEIPADT